MSETIRDKIEEVAADGIQSASIDGQSATALPIADLIAADRYASSRATASSKKPGFRMWKIKGNAP